VAEAVRALDRALQWIAWGALILLLPVTSLPWLAELAGSNTVAPPAILPLVWLFVVWLLPYIFKHGTLPRLTIPFLGFVIVSLIASLNAYFLDVPPFKETSVFAEQVDALITLGIGAGFYLVLSAWPRQERRLRFTLQLLNLGGLVLVMWSLWQGYAIWFEGAQYPQGMIAIQRLVSLRRLFPDRVTGLAYEPSWLAHQLTLVFLPYWLAATLQRFSAHRLRLLGLSLENALLLAGIATLFLSFSRIGILAFLLVVSYLVLRGSWRLALGVSGRLTQPLSLNPGALKAIKTTASLLVLLIVIVFYIGGSIGLVFGISRYDARLAAIFNLDALYLDNFFALSNQLAFAERVVYWATGWEIFNDHPFLGVGLGNAGFFFPEKMPAFGWELWETGQLFYRLNFIPNTKSMWTRLLAETGLTGFALFLTWLFVAWRAARLVRAQSGRPLLRVSALAGELALVAFLIEGFSIDSFALPYLWVATGLLTAATDIHQPTSLGEALPDAEPSPQPIQAGD
jgi:hypothetical protein